MVKFKNIFVVIFTVLSCTFFFVPSISAKTINSGTYNIIVYNQNDVRIHNLVWDGWGTSKQFAYSPSGANNVGSVGFLIQLPEPLLNDTYYDFEFDITLKTVDSYQRVNIDGYDVSGWEQYIGKAKFGVDQDDNHILGYLERGYVTSSYVDSIMVRLYLDEGYYGTFYTCLNSFEYKINGTAAGFDETNTIITSGISNIDTQIQGVSGLVNNVNSNVSSLSDSIVEYNSSVQTGITNLDNSIRDVTVTMDDFISDSKVRFDLLDGALYDISEDLSGTRQDIINSNDRLYDMFHDLFYYQVGDITYDRLHAIDDSLLLLWSQNTNDIIPAINNINSNLSSLVNIVINGFNNLQTNLLNALDVINTDIQEQMIAQTTNLLNSVAIQTNTLNGSIKTMESSIVNKLDDTLVLKDNSVVSDNDSINHELDSTVTDYDSIEQGLVTDFNDKLDSIDVNSAINIYDQSDFIKSAQFVSTNLQNIYESNDFVGGMVDLILLLGLIMTVIGICLKR